MATLVADSEVQENSKTDRSFQWWCWWAEHRWVFPFSPEVSGFPYKRAAWISLTVGNNLGSLQGLLLLPRLISAFLSPLPTSLCNHCIRPAHCLSVHPQAWGSSADESQVPHTGRPREFSPEDNPAEKHSGQYCICSPQRQPAPLCLRAQWAQFSSRREIGGGASPHSFLTNA